MTENQVQWNANTVIYNYNDEADFAYLLIEGEVLVKSKNGKKVGFINKNEIFGEQSILLGTNRTVSAIALKNSTAIQIPKDKLIKEFKDTSILIKAVLRSTYLRLTNLDSTIKNDLDSLENFDK